MSLTHLSKLNLIEPPEGFRPLKFFSYEVRQNILKEILKSVGNDPAFHFQYKLNNLPQFEYLCHTLSESFYLDLKDFELTRNATKIMISWFISKSDLPPCLKPAMSKIRGVGEIAGNESTESLSSEPPASSQANLLRAALKKGGGTDGEHAVRLINQLLLHFSSVFEMDDQYEDVGLQFLEQYQLLLTTVIGFYVQFARTWAFKMVPARNPPRDILDISTSRLLFKITIGLVDYCLKKNKTKEQHQLVWQKILNKACAALLSVIFSSKDLSDESWNELQSFFKDWLNHPNIAHVWSSVIFSLTEHIQFLSVQDQKNAKVMDIVKINLPGNEVLGVSLTEQEFFEFWSRFISLGNTILSPLVLKSLNPESFYLIYLGLNNLCCKLIDMENNNILIKNTNVIISSNSILKLFGSWLMTGACFEDVVDIMHFKGRAEATSCLCRIFTNDIHEGVIRGDFKYNGSFDNDEIACILAIIEKRLNSDFFSSSKLLYHVPLLLSLELQGIEHLLPNILQSISLFIPMIDGADNLDPTSQQSVQMAAIENLKYLVAYYYKYAPTSDVKLEFDPILNDMLLKSFKSSESLGNTYYNNLYRLLLSSLLCKLTTDDEYDLCSIINSLTILSIENSNSTPNSCTTTIMALLDKIEEVVGILVSSSNTPATSTPATNSAANNVNNANSSSINNIPSTTNSTLLINSMLYAIHALLDENSNNTNQSKVIAQCLSLLPILITNYKILKQCIFTCLYTIRKSFYYCKINIADFNECYRLYIHYSEMLAELEVEQPVVKAKKNATVVVQDKEIKPWLLMVVDVLYIIHKQCYTMHYFQFGHLDVELPEIAQSDMDALIRTNKEWSNKRIVYNSKTKTTNTHAVSSHTLFVELSKPGEIKEDEEPADESKDVTGVPIKFYHGKDCILSVSKLNESQTRLIVRNRNGQFEYIIKEQGNALPKMMKNSHRECRTPLLQLNLLNNYTAMQINSALLDELKSIDQTNYLQTINIFVYNSYKGNKQMNLDFISTIGHSSNDEYSLTTTEDEQFRYHFYSQLAEKIELNEVGGLNLLDGFYSIEKINAFVYFESYYSNMEDDDLLQQIVDVCTDDKLVGLIIIFKQLKTKGLYKCMVYKRNIVKKLDKVTLLKDSEQNQQSGLYKSCYNSAPLYHNCIVNAHKIGILLKNTISMFEIMDKPTILETDRYKLIKNVASRYSLDLGGPLQVADLLLC